MAAKLSATCGAVPSEVWTSTHPALIATSEIASRSTIRLTSRCFTRVTGPFWMRSVHQRRTRSLTQREQSFGDRYRKWVSPIARGFPGSRRERGRTMNILWAIIAGLIIGALARLVLCGPPPSPLWPTHVLGLVGGLIGNWIAGHIGVRHTNGVDWIRHILQVAAAAVLI